MFNMLFLLFLIYSANCANILISTTLPPCQSHYMISFRLAKELCQRGHDVTLISAIEATETISNLTQIVTSQVVDENLQLFKLNGKSPAKKIESIFHYGVISAEETLLDKKFKEFREKTDKKFDLIMVNYFENHAYIGILQNYFKAPIILIGSTGFSHLYNFAFKNPSPSAYIPAMTTSFSQKMNFWERMENFIFKFSLDLMRELVYMPQHREMFKRHVSEDADLDDILSNNISLLLTYSSPIISGIIPHLPTIIEVGGFHLKTPQEMVSLDEDLKTFLDDGQDGAVVFAMDSLLRMEDLTKETIDKLMVIFSKLKQRVIWRYGGEVSNIPDNVKIMKWIPQQEVLAHPNIRAFICHGGLLSIFEGVYNGVPLITVPIFGDHGVNAKNAVDRGFAIEIPLLSDLATDKLSSALDEILHNPKYKDRALHYSKLLRDQPRKPLETAIFWIEHVIRYQGAPHLKSPSVDLTWYQRELIDVLLFLLFVGVCVLTFFYIILRKIFSKPVNVKIKIN